jgi:hypothetical protein
MKGQILVCIVALSLSDVAWAIDDGPSSPQQAATERWLQLQPRGVMASPIPHTVTPTERDLSLQRWLNSYQHPIPEYYEQDKGGKMSGGSR